MKVGSLARILWLLALTSMACGEPTKTPEPAAPIAEDAPVPEAPAPQPPAPEAPPPSPPEPPAPTPPEAPVDPVAPGPVSPESPPAPPVPTPPPDQEPEPAPEASLPPPPEFEFETLETRLRETEALGFFTKLELKNEIDDLMSEVRHYHQRNAVDLEEIREEFDLLVLKVMTLLQDEEAELASEISRARGELWAILADPKRFAELEAT